MEKSNYFLMIGWEMERGVHHRKIWYTQMKIWRTLHGVYKNPKERNNGKMASPKW